MIVSTIPKKTPTTIPQIETSTIIETSPTRIYNCSYFTFEINCIFTNLTNEQIHDKLKQELVSTYPVNGASILVNASDSYSFQVTNTLNERNIINNNMGRKANVVDLGECEQTLKGIYHIDNESSIIILKYYQLEGASKDKKIQYELYHPTTYEKLNLSYCQNNTYELYIPIAQNEEIINIFLNAKEQGYDLFNPDDPFYSKICTRYTSEGGTDVLLDDRISFYFNKVANYTTCPDGCKFISYSSETQDLKCECGIIDEDISTLDLNKITTKNTYKAFLSTLKYSNYKVMRCYNLVFNYEIFRQNIGSILTLILFIIYLCMLILYICKDNTQIKVSIAKIIFRKNSSSKLSEDETLEQENSSKKDKKKSLKFPPKKRNKNNSVVINSEYNKKTDKIELIESSPEKSNKQNIANYLKQKKQKKIEKHRTKSVTNSNQQILGISKFNNKSSKKDKIQSDESLTSKKYEGNKQQIISKIGEKNNIETLSLKHGDYDNFELNNLEYIPACEHDKRSFFVSYWSVLLREHIAIMTFFAWYDYNLFYIKLNRFLIQFCTNFTMNGMFFSDESMHYLYVNNGEYNFVQKIPQMAISIVIGHILEVILCYLSLTDAPIYQIKELARNKTTENKKKIFQIIKCIRRKLIIFNIFTFLLFLFYWYFISAFCAVYPNTQKIFIRDSMTSFLTSMIDPLVIYGITSILRTISLSKCCKKKASFVYGLSEILPMF